MFKNKKAADSFHTAFQNTQTYYNKNKKQFPPYGKQLNIAFQHGYIPTNDIFLFIGGKNAWEYARAHKHSGHDVLVLPQDSNPISFIWPVKNCSVLVFDMADTNYQIIRCLAYCLLKHQAKIVYMALQRMVVFGQGGHIL